MAMEKFNHQNEIPLLAFRDIRDAIIAGCLEENSPIPFEEKIALRHRKRQKDSNRYYEIVEY
jgi:hypothetical protein